MIESVTSTVIGIAVSCKQNHVLLVSEAIFSQQIDNLCLKVQLSPFSARNFLICLLKMTRRVRAGNTQKHQKVPEDATKWGEFDQLKPKNSRKKRKEIKNKPNSKQNEKSLSIASNSLKGSSDIDSFESQKQQFFQKTIDAPFEAKKIKKRKNKSKSRVINDKSNCSETQDSSLNDSCPDSSFNEQTVVPFKKHKKNEREEVEEDVPNSHENDKQDKSKKKVFEKKKEAYMKKLQDRRAKNGILLLPSKIERKLYIIKKKLREKGVPSHVLKDIIRKERRKEELKFRKTFNPSKLCFNCRKPGHVLADCPQRSDASNQETGICFKCGSVEHTSFKCPKKVQGFPFATCFICKEQGHISRDCPSNKHGIYPKGGMCSICGNVNHLRKDCPSLQKKVQESVVTLHTINEGTSLDDEIIEKRKIKKGNVKKPKIVKF